MCEPVRACNVRARAACRFVIYVCLRGCAFCGVVWCECACVLCGVVWCACTLCGVVWCACVLCGVVWCGVPVYYVFMWCGVVCLCIVWCACVLSEPVLPHGLPARSQIPSSLGRLRLFDPTTRYISGGGSPGSPGAIMPRALDLSFNKFQVRYNAVLMQCTMFCICTGTLYPLLSSYNVLDMYWHIVPTAVLVQCTAYLLAHCTHCCALRFAGLLCFAALHLLCTAL